MMFNLIFILGFVKKQGTPAKTAAREMVGARRRLKATACSSSYYQTTLPFPSLYFVGKH
jgi:hypothetical protein